MSEVAWLACALAFNVGAWSGAVFAYLFFARADDGETRCVDSRTKPEETA